MTDVPRRFAALRNRECTVYLVDAALMVMADNIEHVVTYWVLCSAARVLPLAQSPPDVSSFRIDSATRRLEPVEGRRVGNPS